METRSISPKSLDLFRQYREFTLGNSTISIPYFNNKTKASRGALRVEAGKGSPQEISNEIKELAIKNRVDLKILNQSDLKKFLVDKNIGVDCSGYAYHILDLESESRNSGSLIDNLKFPLSTGLLGMVRAKIRPVENAGVKTFAHNENSKVVDIKDIKPGDMITMIGNEDGIMRDHILIIYKIDYENNLPKTIYYTHSVAWPTDGEYGHGVAEGIIEITDINKNILEQSWIEKGKTKEENYTFMRARKSETEIRRLNWF